MMYVKRYFLVCRHRFMSDFIMENIKKNEIFQFHPDVLEAVRKNYDLDKPERMAEAIALLDDWIKKQDHFNKKDFDKIFLEKIIIMNKGQIERAKEKIDKICTINTQMPQFFGAYSFKEDPEDLLLSMDIFLPKMTPENYRVIVAKRTKYKPSVERFYNFIRRLLSLIFYGIRHDYCTGHILVLDYMDLSISDLLGHLDLEKFQQGVSIITEGFGTRVKSVHVLFQSQLFDMVMTLIKPILPKKITDRIVIHNTIESLTNALPKEILPVEYGGTEKPFMEIYDKLIKEISSKDHLDYMKEISKATVDERRRTMDKFNEEYLGIPGTFRNLCVD